MSGNKDAIRNNESQRQDGGGIDGHGETTGVMSKVSKIKDSSWPKWDSLS